MPELPEVESFRLLADKACFRTVESVYAPDAWYVKGGYNPNDLVEALQGNKFVASRRKGKLLLLDCENNDLTLGIHFGMTGRLQVDGVLGVEELRYGTNRVDPNWQRFGVNFDDKGVLFVHDPRRLGGVELNPDESLIGPDALSISYEQLRDVFDKSSVPIKVRIMDQRYIAGIGNLIADEVLWRASLDPARASRSLNASQTRALHTTIVETIPELISRGGSHLGDLIEHRVEGGRCPRDGAILIKQPIGGRTTWFCPKHQR